MIWPEGAVVQGIADSRRNQGSASHRPGYRRMKPVGATSRSACISHTWGLVPVRRLRAALITLGQKGQATHRHVKPCGRCIRRLPHLQSQAPQLRQVRRRREREIEIDAVPKVRHGRTIESPPSLACSHDAKLDRIRSEPALDASLLHVPREVAHDVVGQPRGDPVVPEDGRPLQPPSGIAPIKPTSIMPRRIQPSPENRGYHHSHASLRRSHFYS